MGSSAQCSPCAEVSWEEDPRAIAAHAIAAGRALCNCDYPYHVLWPILRAAGITGSLRYQEDDALTPILTPLISDGTRILIAGSADTGTLCVAGRIAALRQPNFTVIDRCPAPLRLVDEFAAKRRIACETLCADLTEFSEVARWDVVLINYTLQYVAAPQRPLVLKNLARALVPGGTLVCVAKTAEPVVQAAAAGLESRWLEKARNALRAAGLALPIPAAELDQLLRQAAVHRTMRRRTIPSRSELIDGLHNAALVLSQDTSTPREQVLELQGAPASEIESSIILSAMRPL